MGVVCASWMVGGNGGVIVDAVSFSFMPGLTTPQHNAATCEAELEVARVSIVVCLFVCLFILYSLLLEYVG